MGTDWKVFKHDLYLFVFKIKNTPYIFDWEITFSFVVFSTFVSFKWTIEQIDLTLLLLCHSNLLLASYYAFLCATFYVLYVA